MSSYITSSMSVALDESLGFSGVNSLEFDGSSESDSEHDGDPDDPSDRDPARSGRRVPFKRRKTSAPSKKSDSLDWEEWEDRQKRLAVEIGRSLASSIAQFMPVFTPPPPPSATPAKSGKMASELFDEIEKLEQHKERAKAAGKPDSFIKLIDRLLQHVYDSLAAEIS